MIMVSAYTQPSGVKIARDVGSQMFEQTQVAAVFMFLIQQNHVWWYFSLSTWIGYWQIQAASKKNTLHLATTFRVSSGHCWPKLFLHPACITFTFKPERNCSAGGVAVSASAEMKWSLLDVRDISFQKYKLGWLYSPAIPLIYICVCVCVCMYM